MKHHDIVLVYDDRELVPDTLRDVIKTERFSQVVKKQRRLGQIIEAFAATVANCRFASLGNAADVTVFERQVETGDAGTLYFWLPSYLMPEDADAFVLLLQKAPWVLGNTIIGTVGDRPVPAVLRRDAFLRLLETDSEAGLRQYFRQMYEQDEKITDPCRFQDLRDVGTFLGFIATATETRHYNHLVSAGHVFRKTSGNIDKMRREYRFSHEAPEALKRFFLPTFDYHEEKGSAGYSMEYMPIPDAAIQLIHGALDETGFMVLLDRTFDYLSSRPRQNVGRQGALEAANQGVWGKLVERYAQFKGQDAGQQTEKLLAATGIADNLDVLLERAKACYDRAVARDDTTESAFSHADPCFSNILFQQSTGIFKLIDPRGIDTAEEGYIHPLYDLAKISHSILGGYDYINHGLYDYDLSAGLRLELVLQDGGPPQWMRRAFADRLATEGYNLAVIRAYEATLFLSMLPLHVDHPRKLPAFLLTADHILTALESEADLL